VRGEDYPHSIRERILREFCHSSVSVPEIPEILLFIFMTIASGLEKREKKPGEHFLIYNQLR
jgi:hypothetical protein